MKKYLVSFLAFALVLGAFAPIGASAQSTSVQAQLEMISQLTKQIQELQTQINNLKQKQGELRVQQAGQVATLVKSLKQGSTGDDVLVLQALLAADPEVYPEGLITGLYGPLTAKAVRKFQSKHGIEQAGVVGPKTLKKLNELLKEHPLALSDDDEDEDNDDDDDNDNRKGSRPCAIVPPGHLIAKGWLKKNEKPVVPPCQTLPPGIDKKYDDDDDDDNSTTTPDTVAPVITAVAVGSITTTGATITWTTNENSDSDVYFSTVNPLTKPSSTKVSSNSMVTSHSINLTGLTPTTVYYFVVESKDASGNESTSVQGTFTTATPDTTAPVISAIGTSNLTTTGATITWTTNENSDSDVYFSTVNPVNKPSSTKVSNATMVTSHSVNLTGLTPATTYYFIVESKDSSNNESSGAQGTFTTVTPDTTAPVISGASVSVSSTSATVIWTTDENSTSKVYYGTTNPLILGSATFAEVGGMVLSHSVGLSSLTASTTYYYVIESKDAANNTVTSSQASFVTTP